jgi:hypothetical protein
MRQVKSKNKDDMNMIREIVKQYKAYYPKECEFYYISDNNKSILLCGTDNLISYRSDVIVKDFLIITQSEDTTEMYKKMNKLIYTQKADLVLVTTNNENEDFFLNNQFRIFKNTLDKDKVTRFQKAINKEKLRKIKIISIMNQLTRENLKEKELDKNEINFKN